MAIPETCLAVRLHETGRPPVLKVEEIPTPRPRSGQVLVRMEFSPLHPADISSMYATYGTKKQLPFTPGLEGAGTVVASGGGFMGWTLLGKRVAVVSNAKSEHGCWQQYQPVSVYSCITIPNNVDLEQAACATANPSTAIMFLELVKTGSHKAVVQNAAAGALGRMVYSYLHAKGYPVINIVRKPEQVKILKDMGATYVLNSEEQGYVEQLEKLCTDLNATVAFDCVGGEQTQILSKVMPAKAHIYVYGNLSKSQQTGIEPGPFLFKGQKIEGAWVTNWIQTKSLYAKYCLSKEIQKYVGNVFQTTVSKKFGLGQVLEALDYYRRNMTEGKVLICPWGN